MTCKDCIHINICRAYETECPECTCNHFKNKADFVEVVKCFWCKHAYNSMTRCYCHRFESEVCENGYCNYGERR